MAYQPHIFVGIGETCAFYTLRETYLHEIWGLAEDGQPVLRGVEERSFHLFNLSQDADEAMTKAEEYSRDNGIRLSTTRERLRTEMRDIKRRTAEEMAEAERLERLATSRRNLGWAQDRDFYTMLNLQRNGGVHNFTFGKHAGEPICKVADFDRDYLEYLSGKLEEETGNESNKRYDNSLLLAQIERALGEVPEKPASKHFGTVGKRTNGIVATVTRKHEFYTDWGFNCVINLRTDAGEELVVFTGAAVGQVGEKLRFNAMIKDHGEYRGTLQTTINRLTKIEVIE